MRGIVQQQTDPGILLSAVVESTDDAIITVDRDGHVTSWNPGAEALYGHVAAEIIGAHVSVLIPPGDDQGGTLGRLLEGEHVAHGEAGRVRKNGTPVTVGETASVLRDADGRILGAVLIARDVSERVEVAEELARTRRQIEETNEHLVRSNDELEQFAYVASHDLSEPLRAVAGMVGLLARRYEGRLDADADDYIRFAVEGCERMRQMIEDLLAYSRAGRVDLRVTDVDLGSVFDDVVLMLDDQISEAHAVVTAGQLPELRADRAQLLSVLQNLISNAVKFRHPERTPRIEVRACRTADAWRIEVDDNGIGVEEQYRERIFRMFQRLHRRDEYAGTGIGLAIAERVVARHGGTMGVASSADGGARFWFTVAETIPAIEEPG